MLFVCDYMILAEHVGEIFGTFDNGPLRKLFDEMLFRDYFSLIFHDVLLSLHDHRMLTLVSICSIEDRANFCT